MSTLLLIVFLDLVGFGMLIPAFPFFAEQVGVDPASVIFFIGLYSAGQLVGAPLWGALSDRVGRRPVLLWTLLANVASSLLLAFVDSGVVLALTRIAAGLAAGNISTAYAYTTDVTTDATRPRALGLLGSAFGLGFVLGPALGGLLAGADAHDTGALSRVAFGAAAMSLLAFVMTWIRLPESLPPEQRSSPRAPRVSTRTYLRRPVLGTLFLGTLVVVGAVSMMQGTLAPFAQQRLAVTPRTLGWIYGYNGVISVIVQAGLIRLLARVATAEKLATVGTLLAAVGMALLPVADTLALLIAALTVFAVGSAILNPNLSTLVARAAGAQERGSVLGAYQGMASLGRVIGPFAASGLARATSLAWPFVAGALVAVVGACVLAFSARESVSTEPSLPSE
jgi:DHA1 family tetracycline resistance protein-like MFS transporter